jgi:hypothetical protein
MGESGNFVHEEVLMMKAVLGLVGVCLISFGQSASADEGLSAAQTSYIGAVMLEGEVDVTFDGVLTGSDAELGQTNYAYFAGNTLYFGTSDDVGNNLDTIIEFFWFESSIDRQSDFYVAIVKARSTPNLSEDWFLDADDLLNLDARPVLSLQAERDTSMDTGAFRWDWSLPFENYGIDSYGTATLTNSYGIGANAEGSAIASTTIDEDSYQVEGTVQTKGYVSTDYKVETQYQVTLHRWDVTVSGNPSQISWDMMLNTGDREEQSAYHEYFIVMQTDVGASFTMEELTVQGSYNGWLWGSDTVASVVLEGLTLHRPAAAEQAPEEDTGMDTGFSDFEPVVDTDVEEEIDEEPPEEPIEEETPSSVSVGSKLDSGKSGPFACGVVSGGPSSLAWWSGLGLVLLARRRRPSSV